MSRFDRRLKPEEFNKRQNNYRRTSSPRPGEATCKLRPANKNNGMLGKTMFMGDNTNLNRPNIEIVEHSTEPVIHSNSYSNTTTMDNISSKNNKLLEKLKTIRDPNIKIIYNHEIRLNVIEATVDCLNDIKCGEVLQEQKKNEETYVIEDIKSKLDDNSELISNNLSKMTLIEKNVLDTKNKNDEIEKKMSIQLEDLERNIEIKMNEKTSNFEKFNNENEELKQKVENIKEILKNILLSGDDNKDELLVEIEKL
tara:strand:+ start:4663 stop:5424 length:762 start_codon:yes stop_codon:yes gene_type:complete